MGKRLSISVATCCGVALGTVGPTGSALGATLPTPCSAGTCGQSGPMTWVSQGAATATTSASRLTINQTTEQAILNWSSFNVSADGKVVFQQPDSTAIALNRIFQGSPSAIFGTIQANGQIYLINPNGLVFGPTASVNASGILASTLNISDPTFQSGLVSSTALHSSAPQLASDGRAGVIDDNGNPVLGPEGKQLSIQLDVANGATLSTSGAGGRILFAGQSVTNEGTLSAPGGQVVLAAGSQVFLAPSTDSSLRGLIVEVNKGGTAWNTLTGNINTPEGNVTMVGLIVNQDGRISASTSVAANGSVELLAQDTVTGNGSGGALNATHSGTLTLGPQGSIQLLPDASDTSTEVQDQPQLPSRVTLSGEQVYLEGGSQIVAPSGQLNVTATANPSLVSAQNSLSGQPVDPNAKIRIDSGALIDLSGSIATLPMSANELTVQLNATELANDPQQRNGLLHGQNVTIDIRQGTTLADVSADIAAIPQNLLQRTEDGGSATFVSSGDVVAASGAKINVSGGYTQYQSGYIAASQLIESNGRTVDVTNADPSQSYVGVINPGYTALYNNWGVKQTIPNTYLGQYEPGYVQGAPAGSITFAGRSMVLDAELIGTAANGPYQRTPSTQVAGGQLVIGLANLSDSDDFLAPSVTFVSAVPQTIVSDAASLPTGLALELPTSYLAGGFTSTSIYSNGSIVIPANTPLSMLPGSSLLLKANDISVDSNISSAGGTLYFGSLQTAGVNGSGGQEPEGGISFGAGVVLDVRGTWTNDWILPAAEQPASDVNVNGGSITATVANPIGSLLNIGPDVDFELSGGAWLQRNGTILYGQGGHLTLQAAVAGGQFEIGKDVGLDAFGVGTQQGGSLTLTADQISIAPLPAQSGWESGITSPSQQLKIGTSLFSQYGLSAITLIADGTPSPGTTSLLTVQPGTAVDAVSSTLMLDSSYRFTPSADSVVPFSGAQLLPVADRTPMSVTLSANPLTYSGPLQDSALALPAGASLIGDPGASFSLSATGGIDVAGMIVARGGTITLDDQPVQAATISEPNLPGLSLTLEPTAVLNASGTTVLKPGNPGLLQGNVLPGGAVNLIAGVGSINVLTGATVDVSGTEGIVDEAGPFGIGITASEVASAGGSVMLQAPQTIQWFGTLEAAAGARNVNAGSLTVDLKGGSGTPTLDVTSAPATLQAFNQSKTVIGSQLLSSSGIDKLVLIDGASNGVIEIDPGVNLNFGRELDLISPLIEVSGSTGTATLGAPYVQVLYDLGSNQTMPATGGATLNINGGLIDLVGSTVFSGISALNLTSTGDIRLTSVGSNGLGSLVTAGNLTLDAERIYPSTESTFSISTLAPLSTLSIGQTGFSPGDPLSVAGAVSFSAPVIRDSGTVLAPFGTISMTASQSLVLESGSLVSVSGNQNLYLYGSIVDNVWEYVTQGGTQLPLTTTPARQISLTAPTLSINQGATVDISGGGDLLSYQWTPGTGGTQDLLSASVSPNLYAILPSLPGQTAPFDTSLDGTNVPSAGQEVYLSGVAGLPAGDYALLPARYALLPGAYLVSAVPGSTGRAANVITQAPDGGTVVSGYYVTPGTQLGSAQTSGFEVQPGSYAYQLADYTSETATTYLTALAQSAAAGSATGSPPTPPTLPASAGDLVLAVDGSLNADGKVIASAATGGQGGVVELAMPTLEVTGPSGTAMSGLSVSSAVLQGWNPARLILGGSMSSDGTTLNVTATDVTVDSGASLNLPDITLVASDNILVQSGASLSTPASTGALSTTPTTLALGKTPGAAFLEISSNSYEVPVRGAETGGTNGTVSLAAGSSVQSTGSIVLDAVGGASLDGTLSGNGALWSLGAGEIDFAASANPGTLTITPALQSAIETGAALRLAANTLMVDSAVNLGSTSSEGLKLLTLDTSSIQNGTQNGTSIVAAESIVFGNPFAAPSGGSTAGAGGSITFSAQDITVGSGVVSMSGFGSVGLSASADLTLSGTGGLTVSGDMSLSAKRVLATSDANSTLLAGGTLNVLPSASPNTQGGSIPVGGAVTLQGQVVNVSGTILLPSGELNIDAAQSLAINNGALLSVAGENITAAGQTVASPGGTIVLTSGGTLSAAAGATVSVAASGNDAGTIMISSGGAAQLDSNFQGQGGSGDAGGSFSVQAASLDDFSALNAGLESGGFTGQRDVHVATGNLVLNAGSELTASQVHLVAESGTIAIGGTITAPSGADTSSIQLYGAAGVTLAATGILNADATGNAAQGGDIVLGTSTGTIDLEPGSVVSARGSAQSGSLTLRAPATSDDVQITEIGADTSGLSKVVIEPVTSFAIGANPSDADLAAINDQVTTYANVASSQIADRLQPGSTPLVVEPGIELDATGDVTLGSLDLTSWRFAGQPGILTVRAAGNVTVNGTIADGFTQEDDGNGGTILVPMTGTSSTIQIVAGANLGSPDPLAIQSGTAADLTLATGSIIKTGTGSIDLAASQDIAIQKGASAYSGGIASSPAITIYQTDGVTPFGTANFLTSGGNVTLNAGRDVVGTFVTGSPADWNVRGLANENPDPNGGAFWGSDPTLFEQKPWNVATLGGGQVQVSAGRDIVDLSAAAADSGIVTDVSSTSAGALTTYGGGSLEISAGRNVDTGYFYASEGSGHIEAGGSVAAAPVPQVQGDPSLGTMLVVGSAQLGVQARQDVVIEGAVNSTAIGEANSPERFSFFSYGDSSALKVESSGGTVTLDTDTASDSKQKGFLGSGSQYSNSNIPEILPPILQVRAYGGDIDLKTIYLFPSPTGQLDLFASGDISGGQVVLSDAAPGSNPTVFTATANSGPSGLDSAASDAIHVADPTVALITAGGDLQGTAFQLAKSVDVSVGQDMIDTNITAQNLGSSDVTQINVGGSIEYDAQDKAGGINVGGPGSLWVAAGGQVDLGVAAGITTTGRLDDPNIPSATGANVTVLAGLDSKGEDIDSFITNIVAPSSTYASQLISFVTPPGATAAPSLAQAIGMFEKLNPAVQGQFVDTVFFDELVEAGRLISSDPSSDYARGYAAIDALFPGSRTASSPYSGDLTLDFSRIYTLEGGNISLLVPGGSVNVGDAVPPVGVTVVRNPSQLGIVAEQAGNVDIYSYGNVFVNSSRIFTLGGGNIAIWSTTANIDAGRGAKSSVSAPPPVVLVDSQGNITLDFSGAVAGSGIRTIITEPSENPGDVDLIAPVGYVNAGDAGIGAAGNLTIAAQYVLNAQNISVGGVAVGVPPEVSGIAASLSGATNAASSTTNASTSVASQETTAAQTAPIAESALSWLDVFVIGLGEENCAPADIDCLKRQKPPPSH